MIQPDTDAANEPHGIAHAQGHAFDLLRALLLRLEQHGNDEPLTDLERAAALYVLWHYGGGSNPQQEQRQ